MKTRTRKTSQFNAWEAYNFNHNKMGSENQDIIVTKKIKASVSFWITLISLTTERWKSVTQGCT